MDSINERRGGQQNLHDSSTSICRFDLSILKPRQLKSLQQIRVEQNMLTKLMYQIFKTLYIQTN